MSKAAFLSITPMIPTGGSLKDALKFYKEQMGFFPDMGVRSGGWNRPRRDLIQSD